MNSFHVTVRIPSEILNMICSHLPTEEDTFSASQVCRHWRGVLISFPPLWTRLPCHRVSRTIASLERCGSMPIQLEFNQRSSNIALATVLRFENKISSLAIHPRFYTVPLLRRLFVLSGSSVERLHVYSDTQSGWGVGEQTAHEIWPDLPSIRELCVSRYSTPIGQLSAPNLTHLALEQAGYGQKFTIQSLLDMLRACPLLETLLIVESSPYDWDPNNPPVHLPYLRSIELGWFEVRSGLITHLQFPSNVAAGFRGLAFADVHGDIPPKVMAAIHHVLKRVDIGRITLALPPLTITAMPTIHGDLELFVRFEGTQGSLELIIRGFDIDARIWDASFSPRGVLFSHSPQIWNVRELHIAGYSFRGTRGMYHINAAMPNLTSISFFHCEGHVFELLTPTNPPSPPFPHLERVMILGSESGLRGIIKTRRDQGVPLKSLVVGRLPERFLYGLTVAIEREQFEYDHLEDYTELEEVVDDLRVGCPTEILEWGTENEILNVWSTVGIPGPVSPSVRLVVPG